MAFIDTINNPIVREMRKDYNRAIAQKIRNRLQQLENANDKDKRRWIWELLQNANDTVSDRQVNIEINVTNEYIEFKHDGGYFSPRNITNLVHQISSKEGEENIGRFGTGFLTTHTLSRVIAVSGIYFEDEDFWKFEITLDRTGNTEADLVECLDKTWQESFKSQKLNGEPQEQVWTSFKYLSHNKNVAKETIDDFKTFIHYDLAFVSSIGSVTVNDELENTRFSIKSVSKTRINNLLTEIHFEEKNNNATNQRSLLVAVNNSLQAAFEFSTNENKQYIIEEISSNVPRLFCAFPLIGTENFLFPMVLNSRKFMPKTERDGLYLKGETIQANRNKPLIESALTLYYATLEFLYTKKAENLYLLAQHENPFQDDYFDNEWYENKIQKSIQQKLLVSPIVKTESGTFETVKDVRFPYHAKDKKLNLGITQQIWEYQTALYPNLIPQKIDIQNWANLLWENCTKINLERFASYLQRFTVIDNLNKELAKVNSEVDVFEWLDNVIGFYIQNGYYLLNKYRISPNQEKVGQGRFCLKDELYVDDNIHEELKDVYEIFTTVKPWRKELLSRNIKSLENKLKSERKVRRGGNIVVGINTRIEDEETDKNQVKKAVFDLIRLLPRELSNVDNEDELTEDEKNKREEYNHHVLYRKDVYRFNKNLFKEAVPEIIILEKLPKKTWEVADRWALDYLVKAIDNSGNTTNLLNRLNFGTKEEVSEWLNELFIFFLENDKRNYLADRIYPNQLGQFRYKASLFEDENIAEEFKDILEQLDEIADNGRKGWRIILLDERITAFQEQAKLQRRTTQDISDEINKLVTKISEDKFEALEEPMFGLVTLINSENRHQRKLWEFLRTFYLDKVPKQLNIVDNSDNFDWQPCFSWCIEHLISDISALENIENLKNHLFGDVEVIDWLNDLIDFIHEKVVYKRLLDGDDYKITPNQNNNFQFKNRLYLDNEIDEDLKQIIRLLNKNWLDDILDTRIYLELSSDKEKTTPDAAIEVDRIFRSYDDDAQKPEYVQSFRIISKWLDKTDISFVNSYMNWVSENKANLALSLLGTEKEKDDIFKIIQSGKAGLLSKIAGNEHFNDNDLKKLVKNLTQVKGFLNQITNIHSSTSDKISIVAKSLDENIKEQTQNAANSFDELVSKFNEYKKKVEEIEKEEERRRPKFTFRTEPNKNSSSADFEAIRRSNEIARDKIYEHLKNKPEYDVSSWTKNTNTIIKNVKKDGLTIGLVVKGADNKVIYMNSSERELLSDKRNFSELWVHSKGEVYQITLGEVLKIWNVQRIKIDMFDFSKAN